MRSRPRFSLCEFTSPNTTFEQDLDLADSIGADLGVCEPKLRAGEEEAQAAALRARGLVATVCVPSNISPLPCEPVYPGPRDLDERVEAMVGSIRRLAPFGPEVIVLVTGDDPEMDRATARRVAVEGLREAARAAAGLGTEISLEPIRRDLGQSISIPTTLRETAEWIEEIGEPNVGICMDVFNVFRTENVIEDAERLATRINSVHVNDWTDPPRGGSDRTFPGDGIIELPEMIAALERGGFSGYYDLEIFAADGLELDGDAALWRLPPAVIARRGRAGFDSVWAAASAAAAARPGG